MFAGGAGFVAGGGGVGCGAGFAAGGEAGRGAGAGAAGRDDDELVPCRLGWLEIWLPAGETANQAAPNAVTPWPLTSPGFLSLMNV